MSPIDVVAGADTPSPGAGYATMELAMMEKEMERPPSLGIREIRDIQGVFAEKFPFDQYWAELPPSPAKTQLMASLAELKQVCCAKSAVRSQRPTPVFATARPVPAKRFCNRQTGPGETLLQPPDRSRRNAFATARPVKPKPLLQLPDRSPQTAFATASICFGNHF